MSKYPFSQLINFYDEKKTKLHSWWTTVLIKHILFSSFSFGIQINIVLIIISLALIQVYLFVARNIIWMTWSGFAFADTFALYTLILWLCDDSINRKWMIDSSNTSATLSIIGNFHFHREHTNWYTKRVTFFSHRSIWHWFELFPPSLSLYMFLPLAFYKVFFSIFFFQVWLCCDVLDGKPSNTS